MYTEEVTQTIVNEKFQLVTKKNGCYYSTMKPEDIDRDLFVHLRSQLINLGCAKNEVVNVAKRICMGHLQIQSEEEYLKYVFENTYQKCIIKIKQGYDPEPIQDIQNPDYSHINLFSSIYGFEIDYLKKKGIYSGIADIGCGEGLFSILAEADGIEAIGYEIKRPVIHYKSKINLIEDFYDIKKSFNCLIYNHVLEHIQLRPDYYLKLVIDHFMEICRKSQPNVIFVSLPMHFHIPSHLASNHNWVCTDEPFWDIEFKNSIYQNGFKLFHPLLHFSEIANEFNYKIFINNKLGIYGFEK